MKQNKTIKKLVNLLFVKRKINDKKVDEEEINFQRKRDFKLYIKNIEDDETKLLKLQTQYRRGEIKEDELSKEQINKLCSNEE